MSKSLFNEYFAYTPEAQRLSDTTYAFYKGIFDTMIEAGYNPREVAIVAVETITMLGTEKVLKFAMKKYGEDRDASRRDDKNKTT